MIQSLSEHPLQKPFRFPRKFNYHLHKDFLEQGGICFYCKEKVEYEFITRDHVHPKSKGHTLKGNNVWSCRFCNTHKNSRTIYEFRELMCKKLAGYLRSKRVSNKPLTGQELKIEKIKTIIKTCTGLLNENSAANKLFQIT